MHMSKKPEPLADLAAPGKGRDAASSAVSEQELGSAGTTKVESW